MDQKPKPKRLFRLFKSGGKSKIHSDTEQHPAETSFAQPLYSSPYPADPVTRPASSRSRSPATHWPGRDLAYARVAEPVDPGCTTPYADHGLPVDAYDAGLYMRSQSLDASAGSTARRLIIGIDFVSWSLILSELSVSWAKVEGISGNYFEWSCVFFQNGHRSVRGNRYRMAGRRKSVKEQGLCLTLPTWEILMSTGPDGGLL